jgi:hypothetical protein
MSDFANGPIEAMTKAEYDRIMKNRDRPITQRPIKRRTAETPFPDGPGVTSTRRDKTGPDTAS